MYRPSQPQAILSLPWQKVHLLLGQVQKLVLWAAGECSFPLSHPIGPPGSEMSTLSGSDWPDSRA